MKTIKAIVFGTLVTLCSASVLMMFLFMCATDISKIGETLLLFIVTFTTMLGSGYLVKFLYERWYK